MGIKIFGMPLFDGYRHSSVKKYVATWHLENQYYSNSSKLELADMEDENSATPQNTKKRKPTNTESALHSDGGKKPSKKPRDESCSVNGKRNWRRLYNLNSPKSTSKMVGSDNDASKKTPESSSNTRVDHSQSSSDLEDRDADDNQSSPAGKASPIDESCQSRESPDNESRESSESSEDESIDGLESLAYKLQKTLRSSKYKTRSLGGDDAAEEILESSRKDLSHQGNPAADKVPFLRQDQSLGSQEVPPTIQSKSSEDKSQESLKLLEENDKVLGSRQVNDGAAKEILKSSREDPLHLGKPAADKVPILQQDQSPGENKPSIAEVERGSDENPILCPILLYYTQYYAQTTAKSSEQRNKCGPRRRQGAETAVSERSQKCQ